MSLIPTYPPLKPMTRERMRRLKINADQEIRNFAEMNRRAQIQQSIEKTYKDAIKHAKTTAETSFTNVCYQYQMEEKNIEKHTNDIIIGLQELFPGCKISRTFMIPDSVDKNQDMAYITIDWS